MQQGFSPAERNPLEDTKRVVETLKKNGAVDNLHSQAINVLFRSEAFRSEVRQWLRQKREKPTSSREDVDALLDMALAALVGLLAGTVDLQQQQQNGAAGAGSSQPQQPHPQQQLQQQQRGPLLMQQHQRPTMGLSGPPRQQLQQQHQHQQHQKQQQQQQQPQVNISEEVALKLQLALLDMLEAEEKFLQGAFKQFYRDQVHRLQHQRPQELLSYTAEAPKEVKETPLSPTQLYDAADAAWDEAGAQGGGMLQLPGGNSSLSRGGGGGGMGSRTQSTTLSGVRV